MKTKLTCCAIAVTWILVAQAQPFRNLGFEEANTNTTKFSVMPDIFLLGGQGPTSDLLPGWQLFKGSDPVLTTGLRVPGALGASGVVLFSKATAPEIVKSSVEGNYALSFGFNAEFQPWSLVQRGDIPGDTVCLTFRTFSLSPGKPPEIKLNGTNIPIVLFPPDLGLGSDGFLYNVSAFAGQNAELRFIYDADTDYRLLDDIMFVVPEPTSASMMGVGFALLITWRCIKTQRQRQHCAVAHALDSKRSDPVL